MLECIPSHQINDANLLRAVQMLSSAFVEEHEQVQTEIKKLKVRDLKLVNAVEHLRKDTNERLDATNERLDATNERLDATNERLDATNERLDSTNERLGSLEGEVKGLRSDMNHALGEQTDLLRMIAVNLPSS